MTEEEDISQISYDAGNNTTKMVLQSDKDVKNALKHYYPGGNCLFCLNGEFLVINEASTTVSHAVEANSRAVPFTLLPLPPSTPLAPATNHSPQVSSNHSPIWGNHGNDDQYDNDDDEQNFEDGYNNTPHDTSVVSLAHSNIVSPTPLPAAAAKKPTTKPDVFDISSNSPTITFMRLFVEYAKNRGDNIN